MLFHFWIHYVPRAAAGSWAWVNLSIVLNVKIFFFRTAWACFDLLWNTWFPFSLFEKTIVLVKRISNLIHSRWCTSISYHITCTRYHGIEGHQETTDKTGMENSKRSVCKTKATTSTKRSAPRKGKYSGGMRPPRGGGINKTFWHLGKK